MVNAFHGDSDCTKSILLDEFDDFWGMIVGHHEIDTSFSQDPEQSRMVDFVVSVQPFASMLSPCGIRRIDKSDSIFYLIPLRKKVNTICPEEFNSGRNLGNVINSSSNSPRIPSRKKPLPALPRAKMGRSGSKDTLPLCPVNDQRPESPANHTNRIIFLDLRNSLLSWVKIINHHPELRGMMQRCSPEIGNIQVDLSHEATLHQILHDSSERNNSPSTKRLKENPRLRIHQQEPGTDMRDQPRLSTRIAQRTTLGNSRDIGSRNWRFRKVIPATMHYYPKPP